MRNFRYRLGLDIGVQSIGWAVLPVEPLKFELLKLGVHCFESGTGTESDIEKGTDESRNTARRMARSARRLLRRRSQRMVRLANELKRIGLLPDCWMRVPEERNRMFQELDQELSVFCAVGDRRKAHLLPYILRAKALDQRLPEHAVGRALYHLAIRRGFLSNRKTQGKDEDEGVVKTGIQNLEREIQEANCRTLGEYFSKLDPEEVLVRKLWTSRQMHEKEFEMIWDSQARFHPEMTEEAKKRVHHAIFFQRPLKSQKFLIGKCRLEPQHRRAPAASLEMQRFRYWQKILDLTYTIDDGYEEFPLTPEQQDLLAEELEKKESMTFKEIAKLLGFKSSQKVEFNLQRGGEKKLLGNTTSFRLGKVLGDRWPQMTEAEKKTLVDEILQYQSESGLQKRLQDKKFGFTPDEAAKVAATRLEGDYGSLSRRAISKILPLMIEKRIRFKEAENLLYPQSAKAEEVVDFLPPLCKDKGCVLTNPVVTRALTELRKVVNAIIREYGKPERIVVELARDLKRSRKERESLSKKMREQETLRDKARKRIIEEVHIQNPTHTDILKYMLADECKWECPYTGKTITPESLLGHHPQFDIEHILPFSRSLDNSFINKTLCYHEENRNVKKNQTPFEAYHGTERWDEIMVRIKKLPRPKQERFLMEQIPDDFSSRMLNDTRYISRQATTYLAKLYGGQIELSDEGGESGKRRIFTCNGQATSWLRDEWGLNGILTGGRDYKTREDHRHHAIDALTIAFCDQPLVEKLARAAELASERGISRRFAVGIIEQPRPDFLKVVRKAVDEINVSYRSNRKVSGALHEETNYSKPFLDPDSKSIIHYKRVPLQNLKEKDIPSIVDGGIRRIVEQKFKEIKDFKKLTATDDFPFREVTTKEGETYKIKIKSVRLRTSVSAQQIGHGPSKRFVKTGSNHHMEVVAILDEKGNEIRWEGVIVTMFEAYQRHKNGECIVKRDHGPDKKFKFSLFKNEFLLKTEEDGSKTLYRVFKMSQNAKGAVCIGWGKHTDARPAQEVTNKTPGNIKSINPLMGQVIKVKVDYLGRIHPAND